MKRLAVVLWCCWLALPATAHTDEVLRIATDASFPPFHFFDADGIATGFDIELARAVGEHAGFDVQLVVLAYDDLFSGLDENRHDLVAATTGITPEREARYLFSAAYFETSQAALVRTGPGEPQRVVDLSERAIGASGSGTSVQAMYETLAASHRRLDEGEGLAMLERGEIDAWIVDEFVAVRAARASAGTLAVLSEPIAPERYAFVMARGRDALKARLDASLAALERDGRVAELKLRFDVERDSDWPVRP